MPLGGIINLSMLRRPPSGCPGFCLLALLGWAALLRADNFHSRGRQKIVCNGELLDIPCTQTRWKISYLGIKDTIQIVATDDTVYLTGVAQTNHPTVSTRDTTWYPRGYEIVLHSDKVFRGGVPEKVAVMAGTVLLTVGLCLGGFKWLAGHFK